MSFLRTLRTASHIPPSQLAARARAIVRRRVYALRPEMPLQAAARSALGAVAGDPLPRLPLALVAPEGLDAVRTRAAAFAAGRFEFLHHAEDFSGGVRWKAEGTTPLWRYQLQYLGPVLDLALVGQGDNAARLVESWRSEFGTRWDSSAWHPYPASLRLANLCHAAAALGSFEALGGGTQGLVAAHAAFVLEHLEHDVRGNHLLENLRALIVASCFLRGSLAQRCATTAYPLLDAEIQEQILPDGMHFELSPMYHSIVLWRLLEIRAVQQVTGCSPTSTQLLDGVIRRMRECLHRIRCPDGEIPLLGDSARGFAPPADALLGGATEELDPLPRGILGGGESGLIVLRGDGLWAIFDAGPVCPGYLPAHGQADSLTVEVWFDGRRIVGDPGLCEYSGPERAWGRSSRAHSTVTVDDLDSSEVYDRFRVGGRAHVEGQIAQHRPDEVKATMVPWGVEARFSRTIRLEGEDRSALSIADEGRVARGRVARSRLHLAPGVGIVSGDDGATSFVVAVDDVRVRIVGENSVRREAGRSSPEFGLVCPTTILAQDLRRDAGGEGVRGGWVLERLP